MSNMVRSILLIFFITLCSFAYAQDSITADTIAPATDTGVFHGTYVAKHTNGKIAVTGYYNQGVKQGLWKEYDEAGTLRKATKYKNGKVHSIIEYNEEGTAFRFTNKKGKVKKIKDCHCSDRAN